MAVSKKLRFEVFKRDSFTCQYCGRSAPDVVLECDHIEPVAKGGSDDILNLVTSCRDCNQGKRDRRLDDDAVLAKKRNQLADLQERREQIEMMVQWQHSLIDDDDMIVSAIADVWTSLVPPFVLTETALASCKKHVSNYGFEVMCEAMRAAVSHYLEFDDSGAPTIDSANRAWKMVPKIARMKISEANGDVPIYLRDCLYIRAIVRNRMYCCEHEALELLTTAAKLGADIEALKRLAKEATNWTEWRNEMWRIAKRLDRCACGGRYWHGDGWTVVHGDGGFFVSPGEDCPVCNKPMPDEPTTEEMHAYIDAVVSDMQEA